MKAICLYFQVHQPFRLRNYRFFEMGSAHNYYDDYQNQYLANRIAERCYLPMNEIIYQLIQKYKGKFKLSFSISGVALQQFEWYAPQVLESFQRLAKTGQVEFLGETYAHSLSSLKPTDEFAAQVRKHSEMIERLFGQKPTTFRNTELIYSDEIGEQVYRMGFKTMLTEGAKHILGWKSPNYVYCNALQPKLKVLMRNYQLSDDISFRFSNQGWKDWPLTAEKFSGWIQKFHEKDEVLNLFMDYETFGEHQEKETGIFDFMANLPGHVLGQTAYLFSTPSEITKQANPIAPVHVPFPISWADEERDLSAWLGNELQNEAFEKLYELAPLVAASKDPYIQQDWAFLQSSDHFYYMCTKWLASADVHKHFSPYASPYDAFINYMNILSDYILRLNKPNLNTNNKPLIMKKATTVKKATPAVKAEKASKPAAKPAAAKKVTAAKPAAKAAAKPAAKPAAKKATAAAKPAVKKAVVAKKTTAAAKPAAKKAVVAKKATAAKPAAKKAVVAKKATAAKPAAKKAVVAKKATAAKPAAKKAVVAKKATAAKPAAKPAAKKATPATKPAVKKASKPAVKKATPAKKAAPKK